MSQRSQVSRVALWMSGSKVLTDRVSEWVSESATRSPIELFWTAKNVPWRGRKRFCITTRLTSMLSKKVVVVMKNQAGWQKLDKNGISARRKGRDSSERKSPPISAILSWNSLLSQFTSFFEMVLWSFQQKSAGFRRAFNKRNFAFGELSTKVILLSESFQQKSACFQRAFNESQLILGELSESFHLKSACFQQKSITFASDGSDSSIDLFNVL